MSAGINSSIDWLQKLFPSDDLMLGMPVHQPQRTTLPEPIKRYKLTKKRKPVYNSSVPSLSQIQFVPDRTLILCSTVQLHKHLSTYTLFLITDVLILSKGCIRDCNMELKERIEICQLWVQESTDDSKNNIQSVTDASLVIGWPLVNLTLTFDTVGLKQQWKDALIKQIGLEKAKEPMKFLHIKVEAKMTDATMCKMIQVRNDETSSTVVQRLLKELRLENREVQDFQLCVTQEPDEPTFELAGHEFPFCIQVQDLKLSGKDPQDKMAITERRPLFLLRDKKKLRANSEEQLRAGIIKSKRKKLKNIFKKSTKNSTPSKFFGQNLSAIFIDGYPPQNLKSMVEKLFEIGPYCNGIFRKSANHAKLKQITSQLDSGLEVDFSTVPAIMIANIMKKFLRSLPDCLLMSHLYYQWLEVARETDEAVAIAICKKQYGRLLPFNQSILLDLMCILRHIEEHAQYSIMTASSLAICIGPSLLWPPRVNNSSQGSSNSIGGCGMAAIKRNNDAEDDAEAGSAAITKNDFKINTASLDADDVNKVIETLIKHSSKIFGNERYQALTRSFHSLRVKPLQDTRDASTDAESAVSSEACEEKSHFSSMGTVDDSTECISGDEKLSSLEENQDRTTTTTTGFQRFSRNLHENKTGVNINKDLQVNSNDVDSEFYSPTLSSTRPILKIEIVTSDHSNQSLSTTPRLVRQQRLVEESSETTSSSDEFRSKRVSEESHDSTDSRQKETISTAFANIARKLLEGRKKELNSSIEILNRAFDQTTQYDAGEQVEAKVGILQRRGMTEKGEDVFPKQIVHTLLPKKNVSVINLNEVNGDDDDADVETDDAMQSKSFSPPKCTITSSESILTTHLHIHNLKSALSSINSHQKMIKNVLFGRRLPQKLNDGSCLQSEHSIRLPPPSYEEATEYLKKRNSTIDEDAISSDNSSDLLIRSTFRFDENSNKASNFKVHFESNPQDVNKENKHLDPTVMQKPGISQVHSSVIKSPTSKPNYLDKYNQLLKLKETLTERNSFTDKDFEEWDTMPLTQEFVNQGDRGELTLYGQRRRRKQKRHSDPRLARTNRKSCKKINRSRSDVADSLEMKAQKQKVNIPDLLADLKTSGVLVDWNKSNRLWSRENANPRFSQNENHRTSGDTTRDHPNVSKNNDWRTKLAKHFQEIDENVAQEVNGCERPSNRNSDGIPSSIVGNCRQKFERLVPMTFDCEQTKADDERLKSKSSESFNLSEGRIVPLQSSLQTFISSNIPTTRSDSQTSRSGSSTVVETFNLPVSDYGLISSKCRDFDKIKSMFDRSTSMKDQKITDKVCVTPSLDINRIRDVISSSKVKSSVPAINQTMTSGNSTKPKVSSTHLSYARKSQPNPTFASAVVNDDNISRPKAVRDENLPWSVSELKKIYANRNTTSVSKQTPGYIQPESFKRQSLPTEAGRYKH